MSHNDGQDQDEPVEQPQQVVNEEPQAVDGANPLLLDDQAGDREEHDMDSVGDREIEDEAEAMSDGVDDDPAVPQAEADGQRDDGLTARKLLKMHAVLQEAGHVDEAAARLVEARSALERAGGDVRELHAQVLRAEARALRAAGRLERAHRVCEEAVRLLQRHARELPGALVAAQIDLAVSLADLERLDDGMALLRVALLEIELIADASERAEAGARAVALAAKGVERCGYMTQATCILDALLQHQRAHDAGLSRVKLLLGLAKLHLCMKKSDEQGARVLLDEAGAALSHAPKAHPSQVELAILESEVDEMETALAKLEMVEMALLDTYNDEHHPGVLRVRLAKATTMLRENWMSVPALDDLVDTLVQLGVTVKWPAGTPWSAPERPEERHVSVAVEMLRVLAASYTMVHEHAGLSTAVRAYKTALAILPPQSLLQVPCLMEMALAYARFGRTGREVEAACDVLKCAEDLLSEQLRVIRPGDRWLWQHGGVSLLRVQGRWALACMESNVGAEDLSKAVPLFRKAASQAALLPELARAALHHDTGHALARAGGDLFEKGIELLATAADEYGAMGHAAEQTRCLTTAGYVLEHAGRWVEAASSFERADEVSHVHRSVRVMLAWSHALLHSGSRYEAERMLTYGRDSTRDVAVRECMQRALEEAGFAKPSLWHQFRRLFRGDWWMCNCNRN